MTKEELIDRLCDVTRYWTDYEDVPESQKHMVIGIGKQLHDLGGMRAMQDAYYAAKGQNRAASVVQAYFDGIGDWRW